MAKLASATGGKVRVRTARQGEQADAAAARRAAAMARAAPPLDPDRLPGEVVLTPGRDVRRRAAAVFGVGLALGVLLGWSSVPSAELVVDPLASAVPGIAAGVCLALAAAAGAGSMLWQARGQPRRLRLRLEPAAVTLETEAVRWTEPVAAYSGLAERFRLAHRRSAWRPGRYMESDLDLSGSRADRFRNRYLHWIELVHPDPGRTVTLWASESDAAAPSQELAARFSTRLGLPVLAASQGRATAAARAVARRTRRRPER